MSKRLMLSLLFAASAAFLACSQSVQSDSPAETASETLDLSNQQELYTMEPVTDADGIENAVLADGGGAALNENQEKRLNALLAKLEKTSDLNTALGLSSRLADFGKAAYDPLEEKRESIKGVAKIALLRALYSTSRNNKQLDKAVRELATIAGGKDDRAIRVAAAEMLERLASPRHSRMLKKALENSFDTPVQIALSVALWNSAKDNKALATLKDMLKAESRNTQLQAAIGLAKVQRFEDAKSFLRIIANEPTLRGMTAKELIKRDRLQRKLMNALVKEAEGDGIEVDLKILEHLIDMIGERYIYQEKVGRTRLKEKAAEGLLAGFDPYCAYLDESQAKRADAVRRFEIPSLGITLGASAISFKHDEQAKDGLRVASIVAVRDGSPADKAGLEPGDRIYDAAPGKTFKRIQEWRAGAPTGHEETIRDFLSLSLDNTIEALRGEAGQSLALLVNREAWSLSRWVALEHAKPVALENTMARLEGRFNYAKIRSFNSDTPKFMKEFIEGAAEKENRKAAHGMLIDLRSCSGGSIEAAIKSASMLLSANQRVAFSFGRHSKVAPRKAVLAKSEFRDVFTPVVLLVDSGTADAAEIFAAALQDHKRATLVGGYTFGRALIQKVIPLKAKKSKHALLLTVGKYYTPKSESPILYRGLTPDVQASLVAKEGWVLDELDILRESGVLGAYVSKLSDADATAIVAGAPVKEGKVDFYPAFADFLKKAQAPDEIHLSEAHLRRALRQMIRQKLVSEGKVRGGDLQEDKIFMAGLESLAKSSGVDLTKIDAYRAFIKNDSPIGVPAKED